MGRCVGTLPILHFLRQSGKQHNKLTTNIQNNFTTGNDRYPKTCRATIHLLDKYSKSLIVIQTTYEVDEFYQKSVNMDQCGDMNTYDKNTGRKML